jgi:hypothetical protein
MQADRPVTIKQNGPPEASTGLSGPGDELSESGPPEATGRLLRRAAGVALVHASTSKINATIDTVLPAHLQAPTWLELSWIIAHFHGGPGGGTKNATQPEGLGGSKKGARLRTREEYP